MATLAFDIPDDELQRVSLAFCEMKGHAPCGSPECLLEIITKMVINRVTTHEKLKAANRAEALVPSLVITPQTSNEP